MMPPRDSGDGGTSPGTILCPRCGGAGWTIAYDECPTCGGAGEIPEPDESEDA